jgi:hypothetical protein
MKVILCMLLVGGLIGCNPLRHYQKVANDTYRNAPERTLLSRACVSEFPAIRDTVQVVSTVVDSSDYLAVAEAYNQLIDSLIAYKEKELDDDIDSATGWHKSNVFGGSLRDELANRTSLDSLRHIKGFIRTYHPPAVIRTVVKEVPVRNTAIESMLQQKADACRTENDGLIVQAKSAVDERKRARTTNLWLYIVGGLLLFGNVYQLFGKKTLV